MRHSWNYCGRTSKLSRPEQQQQQEALNPRHLQAMWREQQWLIPMSCLRCMPSSWRHMPRIHVDPLREVCGASNSNTTLRITQPHAEPPLSMIAYGRMKREHGDGIYMHRDGSTSGCPSNIEQATCRNLVFCTVCYVVCHLQQQLLHKGCY